MSFNLFTLDQANRLVPEVSRKMAEGAEVRQDLLALVIELEGLRGEAGRSDPDVERRTQASLQEVSALRRQLAAVVTGLQDMGCVVRDFDHGLVDFPAIVDGQPAYLCWRSGEQEIRFWHKPDEGFAGRRPLPDATA